MTWAHLSAIMEPTNHVRRIIGFDTFAGFPSVTEHDRAYPGMMKVDSKEEIESCVKWYDQNRWVGHIPKVELVEGDATKTIPDYAKHHPHLVVSLLYLDFDIFQPTLTAIQTIRPLMPAGAIIAFDELAMAEWPGETVAALLALDLNSVRLERCAFGSTISWAQL